MPKIKENKQNRSQRVSGDSIIYFLLHNIVSIFIFFILTIQYNLYIFEQTDSISYLLTQEFWVIVLQVFVIGMISGILGRVTVFFAIRVYYYYQNKITKKWKSFNRGINKISIAFFLSCFITSLFYVIGFLTILQNRIFDENTLITLIASYLILKIGIFVFVKIATKL